MLNFALNIAYDCPVEVTEQEYAEFMDIYPIPASNYCMYNLIDDLPYLCEFYDIQGKLIKSVELEKRFVSIAGGPLLIDEARAWLQGEASLRGKQNLTLKIEDLELALLSRLVDGPALDGLVGGEVRITGTATKPRLGLEFSSGPITVDGKSLAPIQLHGKMENQLADVTVRVGNLQNPIADFRVSVPVRVTTTLEGAETISVLAAKNPTPLAATYHLGDSGVRSVAMRVKLGQTGDVIGLVQANGKLYAARRSVKVTAGGCGG